MNSPTGLAQPEDNELIRRFCRGEVDAFSSLYKRHGGWVLSAAVGDASTCSKFTDPKEEGQDIASEAWKKALQNVCTNYREDNFRGWLRRIVYTVMVSVCRRRKPNSGPPDGFDPVDPPPPDDGGLGEEELAVYEKCIRKLRERSERLRDQAYDVFVLRVKEGLDSPAVAEQLGIDVNQVYALFHKATTFLADCVKAEIIR